MKVKLLLFFVTAFHLFIICEGMSMSNSRKNMQFDQKEEEEYYPRTGFYLGLAFPYNNIGGGFDGKTVLYGDGEIILLPKMASSFGWGILIGYRTVAGFFTEFSIELNYLKTSHTYNFLYAEGKSEYNMLNLDLKYHPYNTSKIQLSLLFGVCIPWLIVKDGSATINKVGDATFSGGGFNFGCGMSYYINENIAINADIIYRFLGYNGDESIKGASGKWKGTKDSLYGSGLCLNFMLIFNLFD